MHKKYSDRWTYMMKTLCVLQMCANITCIQINLVRHQEKCNITHRLLIISVWQYANLDILQFMIYLNRLTVSLLTSWFSYPVNIWNEQLYIFFLKTPANMSYVIMVLFLKTFSSPFKIYWRKKIPQFQNLIYKI